MVVYDNWIKPLSGGQLCLCEWISTLLQFLKQPANLCKLAGLHSRLSCFVQMSAYPMAATYLGHWIHQQSRNIATQILYSNVTLRSRVPWADGIQPSRNVAATDYAVNQNLLYACVDSMREANDILGGVEKACWLKVLSLIVSGQTEGTFVGISKMLLYKETHFYYVLYIHVLTWAISVYP